VSDFRYAQFCPLARAAEIVGERWTLLIVRELLLGSRRFSDLESGLAGVSTSVLAERLTRLEERGVVERRELPPPARATAYELTATGRALLPVVLELARWGVRFLGAPEPTDHFEPEWARLGLMTLARRDPTPARRFDVTVRAGERRARFHVAGGPGGTVVTDPSGDADAFLEAEAPTLLAVAAGRTAAAEAIRAGALRARGSRSALADFPDLFDLAVESTDT